MKTIKIISVLLFFFCISQSQVSAQYQSLFGQNSTQWVFEWHNIDIEGQDTAYIVKDTFAYGHNWKKFIVTRVPNFVGSLLREDTTIGKVWYKSLDINLFDTIEKLLFDFSLNINDTFDVSNMWTGGPNITTTFENTVDSVYYVNGSKHIRFKGQYYPGVPPENYLFIEGIGGNLGVMWKQYGGLMMSQYLLCSLKDSIQTFYQNKRYNGNCNVFGGTGNIDEIDIVAKSIILSPNPTFNNFSYQTKNDIEIKEIEVYCPLGRKIKVEILNNSIDFSSLSSGIYIIQFTTSKNQRITKKIIKN